MRLDRASILPARPASSDNLFLGSFGDVFVLRKHLKFQHTLAALPPAGRFFEKTTFFCGIASGGSFF